MKKLLAILLIITVAVVFANADSAVTDESVVLCDCETVPAGQTIIIDEYDEETGETINRLMLGEGMPYYHCELWAVINNIPSYPITSWNELCPIPE